MLVLQRFSIAVAGVLFFLLSLPVHTHAQVDSTKRHTTVLDSTKARLALDSIQSHKRDSLLRIAINDSLMHERVYANYTSFGPIFTPGISKFLGTVPDGQSTGLRFSYDIGAIGYFRLSHDMALDVGLLYCSRDIYFANSGDPDHYTDYTLNYVALVPEVKYKMFTVGIGIDLPMSGSQILGSVYDSSAQKIQDVNHNLDVDLMASQIELRAGVSIPIAELEFGAMKMVGNLAYTITSPFKDQSVYKGNIFSALVGLTYQFDLDQ